ncbi:uncharacterized protein F4812DRAFT_410915 [Daldinia caldariorum]|uniref:uncharacterized protein n=1 Tax=Daldinia caldariorum TaxID=326644 RepID=UPI002007D812|nr:uncharacterized protein F4812DRAFT_410915 [Daldinia caldariorum]KAI1472924.1 hypothetical protein F4812DRAFT_410915 [Daldinia caldariorum]
MLLCVLHLVIASLLTKEIHPKNSCKSNNPPHLLDLAFYNSLPSKEIAPLISQFIIYKRYYCSYCRPYKCERTEKTYTTKVYIQSHLRLRTPVLTISLPLPPRQTRIFAGFIYLGGVGHSRSDWRVVDSYTPIHQNRVSSGASILDTTPKNRTLFLAIREKKE